MKKINFSLNNTSQEDIIAESRTTSVAPTDYIGRLHVSRFRVSKNCFPLALIEPSKRHFTNREKENIDALEMTPTDLYFCIAQYNTAIYPTDPMFPTQPIIAAPHNGTCFAINDNERGVHEILNSNTIWVDSEGREETRLNYEPTMFFSLTFFQYYIKEKAQWAPNTGARFYVLENKKWQIHNWNWEQKLVLRQDSIYGNIHKNGIERPDLLLNPTHSVKIDEQSEFPFIFHCEQLFQESNHCTTPVLYLSDLFCEYLGIGHTTTQTITLSSITVNELNLPCFARNNITLKVPNCEISFNEALKRRIDGDGSVFSLSSNFSCSFKPLFQMMNNNLFPAKSILLTCMDLNFMPEIISINTSSLQGVVNPSALNILQSFYVGIENDYRSDFVYFNDDLNTFFVEVNSPRLVRVNIALWILTKANDVLRVELPSGEDLSVQFTLY